jgi:2,3-bisphosphoglycerate-dependent phosphoglycerate mutase
MHYLVLLRHGQSVWNKDNRFTGFKDVELSELGEKEAAEAGRALSHIHFDTVFTSTLKRAYNTAEIALAASGIHEDLKEDDEYKMTRHDDLRERDYGDLTGFNKDETREKFGDEQVHIWRRSYDVKPPGGECLKDVVERVKPYYEEHIKPLIDQGQNVLLAAHGNSLRAMMIILGEATPETINSVEIPTGIPIVFEYEDGQKISHRFLKQA